MNALSEIRAASNLPTYLPPRMDHALRTCVTRLIPPITASQQHYAIALADAPSDALRQALATRCERIDNWMRPAGPEAATEAYKNLVVGMAVPNMNDEEAAREMMGFVQATAKLPLFALSGACDAFRDGVVGDGKWMPKAGQICIEAQKRMAALAKERREIAAVLSAEVKQPVPDSEAKARNLAEARDFIAKTKSMEQALRRPVVSAEKVAEDKAVSDAISAGKPDPRPPPSLSPELRAMLAARGALRPEKPAEEEMA
jgi:hypothetical protein